MRFGGLTTTLWINFILVLTLSFVRIPAASFLRRATAMMIVLRSPCFALLGNSYALSRGKEESGIDK